MAEIRPGGLLPPRPEQGRMIMPLTFDNPKFATEPVHVQAFTTEAYASLASLERLTQGADKDLANVSHLRLLPLEDEVSRRLAGIAARNGTRDSGEGVGSAGHAAAAAAAAAAAPPSAPDQHTTRQPLGGTCQPLSQAAGGGLAAALLPPHPPPNPAPTPGPSQPRAAGNPATTPPGPSMAMSGISGLSAISLAPGRTDFSLDFTGLVAAAAQIRAAEGGAGPSGAHPGPSILGLPPPLPPPSVLRASSTAWEDQRPQAQGMKSAAPGPGKRQRDSPTDAAHRVTGPGPPGAPSVLAPSLPPAAPLPLAARAVAARGPAPRLRQPSEDPRAVSDSGAGGGGAASLDASTVLPAEAERVARERKEARRVAATHLKCLQRDEKKPVKRSGSTYESRNVAPGARGGGGPSRGPWAADSGGAAAAAAAAIDPSLRVRATEVVLTVSIHDPARPGIIMQQVAVLGSQTLAALRDALRCPQDTMAAELGARRPSGYFYFEGTFFTDDRAEEEGGEDYTEAIRDFLVKHGIRAPPVPDRLAQRLGGFRTLPMSQVTFSELWTRIGPAATGLYGHQGSCEHQLAIHDLRTLHPTDSPLVSDYPHETFRARRKLLSCCICGHKVAERLTVGGPHSLEYLSRYCEDCYLRLHYDAEGNSLGAHKVMPYVGEVE